MTEIKISKKWCVHKSKECHFYSYDDYGSFCSLYLKPIPGDYNNGKKQKPDYCKAKTVEIK